MISPIFQMGTLRLREIKEPVQVMELSCFTGLPQSLSTLPQSRLLCIPGVYVQLSHWGPRGAHLEVTRGLRASPAQMSPGSKNSDKFPPYSDLRQQSFLFSLALRFPCRTICVQPSKMVHPRRAKKDLMPESPAPHSPLIFTAAGSEHERTIRRGVPNWLDSLRCLRAKAEEINKQ